MKRPGAVLKGLGVLLILGALGLTGYNVWDGRRADQAAQEAVQQLNRIVPGRSEEAAETRPAETSAPEKSEDVFSEVAEREMPTMEVNGYSYIGILDIPALNLSLPVMAEWDYDRLQISPCRFTGTTYNRDLVICAHNYPHHFRPVKTLPMGTKLTFTDADGIVTTYRIFDVETITRDDVVGMTTGDWDLTLFTCTLEGRARAAIRCELVG